MRELTLQNGGTLVVVDWIMKKKLIILIKIYLNILNEKNEFEKNIGNFFPYYEELKTNI